MGGLSGMAHAACASKVLVRMRVQLDGLDQPSGDLSIVVTKQDSSP